MVALVAKLGRASRAAVVEFLVVIPWKRDSIPVELALPGTSIGVNGLLIIARTVHASICALNIEGGGDLVLRDRDIRRTSGTRHGMRPCAASTT